MYCMYVYICVYVIDWLFFMSMILMLILIVILLVACEYQQPQSYYDSQYSKPVSNFDPFNYDYTNNNNYYNNYGSASSSSYYGACRRKYHSNQYYRRNLKESDSLEMQEDQALINNIISEEQHIQTKELAERMIRRLQTVAATEHDFFFPSEWSTGKCVCVCLYIYL